MVNFKFITPLIGQQIITIHTLSDVSESTGNQTMKFGHLIEHNMRYIFLVHKL